MTRTWTMLGCASLGALGLMLTQASHTLAQPPAAAAATAIDAEALFTQRCKSCHEPNIDRAPNRADMATRAPSTIHDALTTGVMAPMAAGLSPAQINALANHLGARLETPAPAPVAAAQRGGRGGRGAPPAQTTEVMCATNPPIRAGRSDWASFGLDPETSRFQRNPGLRPADVPRLKVKWAFSLVGGGSYGQPSVVGDHLFMVTRGGQFYSMDTRTGCIHWKMPVASRTTPIVVRRPDISPSGWVIFLGTGDQKVHAYDAQNGRELWVSPELEAHPSAGITGSPALYGDQLFVPITSGEEGAGANPRYPCCSFRGSVVAVDVRTGQPQWKTYTIQEPLRPTKMNSVGVQLQGPAGGAIWSAPTVDAKRGLVYVATGDSYTEAATIGADAIIAMDMKTGAIRWNTQVTENDNFIISCLIPVEGPNCPSPAGPDWDFGASPILYTLKGGKQVVLSGQKSGVVYAMDPDSGKKLWETKVGEGGPAGGVQWGMAADDRYVYAPNSDVIYLTEWVKIPLGRGELAKQPPKGRPSLTALDPATGKIAWQVPAPVAPCTFQGNQDRFRAPGCINAQSQAATVIPGAVFSGTTDGWMRAYDPASGKILWAFSSTAQTYDTINGVKGQPGGGFDSVGPTIAGGMMFTVSGYNGAAGVGGNGTNVLLAFSVDGK